MCCDPASERRKPMPDTDGQNEGVINDPPGSEPRSSKVLHAESRSISAARCSAVRPSLSRRSRKIRWSAKEV
jgi:hypothetical protein